MAGRGGQESVALMNNYLARVKDECKPAIYSAFISLMNAYHGNMLAVEAFLDELYVLFSPRVHLLADVKPLIDASYHQRVDELCDKVRSGGGGAGAGVGGAGTTYSFPAALGALSSSSQHTTTNSTSSSNSVLASPTAPSPRGGGGGGGGVKGETWPNTMLRGGSLKTNEGAMASVSVSVSAASASAAASAAAATVTAAATGNGTPRLPLDVAAAGGGSGGRGASGGGSGQTGSSTKDDLDGALSLSSPSSTHGLTTELGGTSDIADLLSGIEEPSVDTALLDIMMCDDDNPSVLGSSAPGMEPPPLNVQQHKPQSQSQPQWSFSTPSPPLTDPMVAKSNNGKTPTTTSPTKKGRGSTDSPSSASSSATLPNISTIRGSTTNNTSGSTKSLQWSRRESSPNLADGPCRIHATPIAGCRNCRWEASLSSSAPAAAPTATRRRCAVAISKGTSKQQGIGRSSLPRGGGRANLPNQGDLTNGVHGGGKNSKNNKKQNKSNNNNSNNNNSMLDMDDGTYHGPGKRVWEKTGGVGSSGGGGGGLTTPGSGSSSPTSFYFPSAAAAAAAAASSSAQATTPGSSNGGGTPSRPNARRKISTDPLPTFIKDDGSGNTGAGVGGMGRRDSMPPSVAGGGARFGGNGGGGMDRRNSLPLVNLDPESIGAKSNGFAGMGGARSLPTMAEDSAMNGSSGGSEVFGRARSGDDLEKLVVSVTTRGMQQALTYGLRNTFAMLLRKKDQEIAELKEEGLRWSANDTRLRQINQQLLDDNMQLRAAASAAGSGGTGAGVGVGVGAGSGDVGDGWDSHSRRGPSPSTS